MMNKPMFTAFLGTGTLKEWGAYNFPPLKRGFGGLEMGGLIEDFWWLNFLRKLSNKKRNNNNTEFDKYFTPCNENTITLFQNKTSRLISMEIAASFKK